MLPDRVSNPGPLTYESGALPIALRGPARDNRVITAVNEAYDNSLSKKGSFCVLGTNTTSRLCTITFVLFV